MAKTVILRLIPNLFIKVSIGPVTDPVYPTGAVFTYIPQMTDSIENVSGSDCLKFRREEKRLILLYEYNNRKK